MSTATLRLSTPLSSPRATKTAPRKSETAPRKSWIVRLYWAIAEARMRAAMREIAMHRHLIPPNVLKTEGYQATVANDGALPFTH